jgi:hypothetical protein
MFLNIEYLSEKWFSFLNFLSKTVLPLSAKIFRDEHTARWAFSAP